MFFNDEKEETKSRLGIEEIKSLLDDYQGSDEYPICKVYKENKHWLGAIIDIKEKEDYVFITICQASGTEKVKIEKEAFKNKSAWVSTWLTKNKSSSPRRFIPKNPDGKVKNKEEIDKDTYLALYKK